MRKVKIGINRNGFTIIEVVAVMVVVGIFAAVALARIASTATYSLASEADTLRMHLRYAQFRALSDDVTWGMAFTGTSYTILRDGAMAPYKLPNEASATHTLPSGVTMSGVNVTFDSWGSPGTNNITITLSSSGEPSQTINITKNTGHIP